MRRCFMHVFFLCCIWVIFYPIVEQVNINEQPNFDKAKKSFWKSACGHVLNSKGLKKRSKILTLKKTKYIRYNQSFLLLRQLLELQQKPVIKTKIKRKSCLTKKDRLPIKIVYKQLKYKIYLTILVKKNDQWTAEVLTPLRYIFRGVR